MPGEVQDDLSVTHKEFRAAREQQLPTITFVEPQVISYREVFNSVSNLQLWDEFPLMDNPRKTFQLLDEITSSEAYNAIIQFNSISDAKMKLKLQIADFVGDRLFQTELPMSKQLKDVFAEITTVRKLLVQSSEKLQSKEDETKRYYAAIRFLLNDNVANYRKLLEVVFDDLDDAIAKIVHCNHFKDVMSAAGYTYETIADDAPRENFVGFAGQNLPKDRQSIYGSFDARGGVIVYADRRLELTERMYRRFDVIQRALHGDVELELA
jgi:hypothetical protein